MNGVTVNLCFWPPQAKEVVETTVMPAVPSVGQRLCWELDGHDQRFWNVRSVTWACHDQNRSVWAVEIGLTP